MTYNDAKRRLFFFEGSVDGQDLPPKSWNFSLPFGVGLAGACFKEADQAFLYEKPKSQKNEPVLYLPTPSGIQHEFLLALPIYIPGLNKIPEEELKKDAIERSRFCIAVVNIGSAGRLSGPHNLNYARIVSLSSQCQEFGDAVCERVLHLPGVRASAHGKIAKQ